MGTTQSANDEWIELFNSSTETVALDGWTLTTADETPTISLSGSISANSYFLLERTNDETVPSISADLIYSGALGNAGETMALFNTENTEVFRIDAGGGWPAGDNTTKETMQYLEGKWITAPATPKAPAVPPAPVETPTQTPPPAPPVVPKVETPPVVVQQTPQVVATPTPEPIKEVKGEAKVVIEPVVQTVATTTATIAPVFIEVQKPVQKVEVKKPTAQKKVTTKTTTKKPKEKSRGILNNNQVSLAGEAYVVERPKSVLETIWAIPHNVISFIKNFFHR